MAAIAQVKWKKHGEEEQRGVLLGFVNAQGNPPTYYVWNRLEG